MGILCNFLLGVSASVIGDFIVIGIRKAIVERKEKRCLPSKEEHR